MSSGTQFTCFISTRVRILTRSSRAVARRRSSSAPCSTRPARGARKRSSSCRHASLYACHRRCCMRSAIPRALAPSPSAQTSSQNRLCSSSAASRYPLLPHIHELARQVDQITTECLRGGGKMRAESKEGGLVRQCVSVYDAWRMRAACPSVCLICRRSSSHKRHLYQALAVVVEEQLAVVEEELLLACRYPLPPPSLLHHQIRRGRQRGWR